jgi:hypothetical protein
MLSNRKNSNHFESTSGDGLVHFRLLPMVVVPCYFIIFFFFFLSMKKKTIPLPISPWGYPHSRRLPFEFQSLSSLLFFFYLWMLRKQGKHSGDFRVIDGRRRLDQIKVEREKDITIRKIGSFYIFRILWDFFRPGSV